MLKLAQLLLCLLGLAVVLALALTYRIRGQTLADRTCELFNSPQCAEWVQRERLHAKSLERLLLEADQPEVGDGGSPHPVAESKPKVVPAPEEKKPLDSVTSHERQTLDKLLSSRGSK